MWVDFCLVLCKSAGAGLVNWWDCSSCLVAMCMWIFCRYVGCFFFDRVSWASSAKRALRCWLGG